VCSARKELMILILIYNTIQSHRCPEIQYLYPELVQGRATSSSPNVVAERLTLRSVFERSQVQISAQKPVVLTEVFIICLSSSRQMPG
jgi:hypothetical protein